MDLQELHSKLLDSLLLNSQHYNATSICSGWTNLGGEYTIKLKPDAKPYSLFTPRHIPLLLHPKVKEELEKMESMGVISRVDEPTEWCAGMVVAPKRGGDI